MRHHRGRRRRDGAAGRSGRRGSTICEGRGVAGRGGGALIGKVVAAYGRLDCAFNNAGIEGEIALTAETGEEGWDRTIAVNLKGVWLCMKYEIPQLLTQGGGSIVNTSSVYGLVGGLRLPAYIASKHGVTGLTRAAALEFAKLGIRINCVCPGAVHTSMIDRIVDGRPGMAETVAAMEGGAAGQTGGDCRGGGVVELGCGLLCHRAYHDGRRRLDGAVGVFN